MLFFFFFVLYFFGAFWFDDKHAAFPCFCFTFDPIWFWNEHPCKRLQRFVGGAGSWPDAIILPLCFQRIQTPQYERQGVVWLYEASFQNKIQQTHCFHFHVFLDAGTIDARSPRSWKVGWKLSLETSELAAGLISTAPWELVAEPVVCTDFDSLTLSVFCKWQL